MYAFWEQNLMLENFASGRGRTWKSFAIKPYTLAWNSFLCNIFSYVCIT